MEEHKANLEKQVGEKLKVAYKIIIEEPNKTEVKSKYHRIERTMKSVEKYLKKKDIKIEYKYAFGQRIPVDHEWRVKQPHKIDRDKSKSEGKNQLKPEFEIVYDYNGRPTKVKVEYSKEEDENDSELADIVDEKAYGSVEVAQEAKEEQTSTKE